MTAVTVSEGHRSNGLTGIPCHDVYVHAQWMMNSQIVSATLHDYSQDETHDG